MTMTELVDKDLLSIQEVRTKVRAAKEAQAKLATFSQDALNAICRAMAQAGVKDSLRLAKMANEETGFGRVEDKVIKNRFGSDGVWQAIKDIPCIGVISEDPANGLMDIGVPMGVIAGIIPSTNPTSTVFYKSLISIKAGNAIVFSPHPSARQCTIEAARLMATAAEAAGCPSGAISCLEMSTMAATSELMKHSDIALILATGGGAMVKAAYSSGNPAIGVGPGNGPAYIERTADIRLAVKRILDSKCFDNGTICASEQSVVTEDCIRDQVIAEFKRQGAYFLNDSEKAKVGGILMRSSGTMNPAIVGKSPQYIAKLAGITVGDDVRVLIAFETEVGDKIPYSKEKLCPVLGFYTQPDWQGACDLCIKILLHEGAGHTMTIHSSDEAVIREFALKKPVSRLLVNTPAALGGVGATTALMPSFTLGCGAVGGSSSSDNIGPRNLINIRRMARGIREIEEIRAEVANASASGPAPCPAGVDEERLIALILQRVLAKLP